MTLTTLDWFLIVEVIIAICLKVWLSLRPTKTTQMILCTGIFFAIIRKVINIDQVQMVFTVATVILAILFIIELFRLYMWNITYNSELRRLIDDYDLNSYSLSEYIDKILEIADATKNYPKEDYEIAHKMLEIINEREDETS